MTTTGLAPRVRLDAPAPRPAPYGILNSPGAAAAAPGRDHWQAGAALEPWPDPMPVGFDPCATGTFREKDVPASIVLPDPFPGFTAYLGQICTAGSIGDWPAWQGRAQQALTARTQWALERQLAWGTFDDSGPFLADADADLPAGAAAVAALVAVAYLEGYLAERGQLGVLHLTPQVATTLGDALRVDSAGQVRTAAGTPAIVGQGYSGTDAENLDPAVSGAGEAAGGQSWIFASSPVLYQLGDVYSTPEEERDAIDRDTNEVVYRAERDLWVAFDGGPHAAALADWTPA